MDLLRLAIVIPAVAGLLLCSAGTASYADARKVGKAMITLAETDNDRTVNVHLGDTVRIRLPENATTGYRWAVDRYDEGVIAALPPQPSYPSNAVGSGGEVMFGFEAKKTGTGDILLKHWRHWEGDASVTARFRVRLNVQP
jgi:inhibitor of cysteine peptidase